MRGKDEEKMIPMFPRLHINDTEKGGPKAPPRNKMALYEQLSVPSQRLSSGSSSFLPLPSTSLSHGGVQERIKLSPLGHSTAESRFRGKLHPFSYTGVKSIGSTTQSELKPSKPMCYKSLKVADSLPSADKNHPIQLKNFPSFRSASLGPENDCRFSTFARPRITCSDFSQQSNGREILPCSAASSSMKLKTTCEKKVKGVDTEHLNSLGHVGSQPRESRELAHWNPLGRKLSVASSEDNMPENVPLIPSAKDQNSVPWQKPVSLNQESASMHDINRFHGPTLPLLGESLPDNMVFKHNVSAESAKGNDEENDKRVRSEQSPGPSRGVGDRNFDGLDVNECCASKECGSVQIEVGNRCDDDVQNHRCDDVSENSIVNSISALELCPDDIVDAMGDKNFWKARSTIVNQQKAYAMQLFELHRLIKVQKRIAGSPHLLAGGNSSLRKGLTDLKNLPGVCDLEPSFLVDNPKINSEKQNLTALGTSENGVEKLPFQGTDSGDAPASAATTGGKSSWCYPPPGNQWLIPVVSPSEGLVYKPYAGPYPPTVSPMAPYYRSCGRMNLTPGNDDFLNTAFEIAPSQHGIGMLPGATPLGRAFFPPPFGMVCSKAEQMQPSRKLRSNGNNYQFPICNVSSQMRRAISPSDGKFQLSKESDFEGSSASSPSNKEKGEALPLFPGAPTVEKNSQTHKTEQQTQVIKVVPHNPRAATESAARIFQSIQEERKKL